MKDVFNNILVNYNIQKVNNSNRFVVFLHGWGASQKSFEFVQNYLSCQGYNTLNFDLPNFGDSQTICFPFSLEDYVQVLVEMLHKLEIKKVDIICHSFGCRIALIFASTYKNLVGSMLIVDGAGLKYKKNIKERFSIFKYKLFKKLNLLDTSKLNKYGSSDYKALDQTQKQNFVSYIKRDLSSSLSHISCKTMLVWGEDDRDTPLYMAKKMLKKIPNCSLVVFKGTGHFCYLERQNEFLDVVDRFLD